jgi:hypothetical protein
MDSFNRDQTGEEPEPVDAVPAAVSTKRQRSRDSLFLTAKLGFAGSTDLREVRVRNLSDGGMMAEVDRVVDVGTAVSIELRGIGAVSGKVAWCTEGRVGIAFDMKIDPQKARKPVGQGKRTPVYASPFGLGPYHR